MDPDWDDVSDMNLSEEGINFDVSGSPVLLTPPVVTVPQCQVRGETWQAATPSPVHSYHSMDSEDETQDSHHPVTTVTRVQLERTDSPASSEYSFQSDDSREPIKRRKRRRTVSTKRIEDPPVAPTVNPELQIIPNDRRHPAMTVPFMFKSLQATLEKLMLEELVLFRWKLIRDFPQWFERCAEDCGPTDRLDLVDKLLEKCGVGGALCVTLQLLRAMKLNDRAAYLEELCRRNEAQYELKISLRRKYESIYEGVAKQGQQTPLHHIFTELLVTEGGNAGVNVEHEVRRTTPGTRGSRRSRELSFSEMFEPCGEDEPHMRLLLSRGMAGTGKSTAVSKFILDWAQGRLHQHFYFIFPVPFRELNLMPAQPCSLMSLLHSLFPETRALHSLDCDECRTLFVCDGLDECRLPLDFRSSECWCDITQPTSLDTLLTNLIRGTLLPSAHVWLTSRPSASGRVPPEAVHKLVDVRGFAPAQREEYVRRKLGEGELAGRAWEHVRATPSLQAMCHLPLFCWLTVTTLDGKLQHAAGTPRALTGMFTRYLLVQMGERRRRQGASVPDGEEQRFLQRLGKLAFHMLQKGQEAVSEGEWTDGGLQLSDVIHSGLCTEIHVEEFVMYQSRMYAFAHLLLQEYMAALYVFLTFAVAQRNVLDSQVPLFGKPSLLDVHRCAVDKALHSPSGHLDLCLRFLLGLWAESNRSLLRALFSTSVSGAVDLTPTADYLKAKLKKSTDPETTRKLSLCLEELEA